MMVDRAHLRLLKAFRFRHGLPDSRAQLPLANLSEASSIRVILEEFESGLANALIEGVIKTAFETAGLNHENFLDWYQLLYCFSWAHFGDRPRRGAPIKWDSLEYSKLLDGYYQIKWKHPSWSDEAIFKDLIKRQGYRTKKGSLSTSRLRKLLTEAKRNKRVTIIHAANTPRELNYFTIFAELCAREPISFPDPNKMTFNGIEAIFTGRGWFAL
jgi:hypothetical protein